MYNTSNITELLEGLRQEKETDLWQRNYVKELSVIELPDAPILLEEVKDKLYWQGTDDELIALMGIIDLLITIGVNDKFVTLPLGDTAKADIVARAGCKGGNLFRKISAADMEQFFKMAKDYYPSTLALSLVRNGKVQAVKSGDEHDYSILPKIDLIEKLIERLDADFLGYEFDRSVYDSELDILTCDFRLDNTMASLVIDKLNAELGRLGLPTLEGYKPIIRFRTSDLGYMSATVFPHLVSKSGKSFALGNALSVEHKHKHTPEDFAAVCTQMFASVKDATEEILSLANITILHPVACFSNLVKKKVLPVKEAEAALEQMKQSVGSTCTAYELYYFLNEIASNMSADESKANKMLDIEERIAQCIGILLHDKARASVDTTLKP